MEIEIDDEYVDAVELAVGMGSGAWDMIDPREIIRAVLTVHERLVTPLNDSPPHTKG